MLYLFRLSDHITPYSEKSYTKNNCFKTLLRLSDFVGSMEKRGLYDSSRLAFLRNKSNKSNKKQTFALNTSKKDKIDDLMKQYQSSASYLQ